MNLHFPDIIIGKKHSKESNMSLEKCSILLFSLFLATVSASTSINFSLSASTGDTDFDLTLRNINLEAKKSLPGFYSSMRVQFGTP